MKTLYVSLLCVHIDYGECSFVFCRKEHHIQFKRDMLLKIHTHTNISSKSIPKFVIKKLYLNNCFGCLKMETYVKSEISDGKRSLSIQSVRLIVMTLT